MLLSLHIENIAVIRRLDVSFGRGFHALTGQTGAGKSILIDSIRFLLGGRADRDLLRAGESEALVSALFRADTPALARDLKGLGVGSGDPGDDILLERTLREEGRAAARVDGRAVSTTVLREAGARLIGIHGQHDSVALLDPRSHLSLLDLFGETKPLLDAYRPIYDEITQAKAALRELEREKTDRAMTADLLKAQIEEIDRAHLREGEEEELAAQRARLRQADKLQKQTRIVYRSLYSNDRGACADALVRVAQDAISALGEDLPAGERLSARLDTVRAELSDIAEEVRAVGDFGDEDPAVLLTRVEERLDLLDGLTRKYGENVHAILSHREKLAGRLRDLQNREQALTDCRRKLAALAADATEKAQKLRSARLAAAARLEEKVTRELAFLDLPNVRTQILVSESRDAAGNRKLLPTGMDEVEFLFSANPGEPLRPLARTASGGELSRIMLALKCVFAEKDGLPSLIFDEIDSGVSGRTSEKIGVKLAQIAREAGVQVFCVTHAAPIASHADRQYLIYKEEKSGRTETSVRALDEEGRVREIARLIGGIEITPQILATAREMLAAARERNPG